VKLTNRQHVLQQAMSGQDRLVFLQLSDFHYGREHFENLRASGAFPWNGLNDHDPVLCRALCDAVGKTVPEDLSVPRAAGGLPLVFTGDLTATGHAAECDAARAFFRGNITDPARIGGKYGLGRRGWFDLFTAGNHDHWGGVRSGRRRTDLAKAINPPAMNPALYRAPILLPVPVESCLITGWGDVPPLRVFQADSNVGFDATERNPTAEGRLGQELVRLRDAVASARVKAADGLMAVAIHHRLPNHRMPPELLPYPLSGSDADSLRDLCAEFGVRAILTGHQHTFWHTVGAEREPPFELRAATPVQATGGARPDQHGFTAHVLVRTLGGVYWVAIAYQLRSGNFERLPFDAEKRESDTNPYPPMFLAG